MNPGIRALQPLQLVTENKGKTPAYTHQPVSTFYKTGIKWESAIRKVGVFKTISFSKEKDSSGVGQISLQRKN